MSNEKRFIARASLVATPESSQIYAVAFQPDTMTMTVQFPKREKGQILGGGSVYQYSNVTPQQFDEFLAAPSKGAYFGAHFKPKAEEHPFVKLTEEEVAEFITAPVEVLEKQVA
jgi:hypothetical protein